MQYFFRKLLLLLVLAGTLVGTIVAQRAPALARHTVQAGETLYHIAKQYGVSVEQLVRFNAGLEGNVVRTGQVLVIPPTSLTPDRKPASATVAHEVKKKETLWSIAQAHGTTVEALVEANPEMAAPGYKLKKGSIIRVPSVSGAAHAARTQAAPGRTQTASVLPDAASVQPDAASRRVKIAVMLPLVGNSGIKQRCLEYYRGFLMAVDSVKQLGQSVELFVYDTPAETSLSSTLLQLKSADVDAIIGPFYGSHITQVCAFAAQNGTKVFIPFTSKVADVYSNPNLFLLNAPEAEKRRAVYDLYQRVFPADSRLVIIRTQSADEAEFADYLQEKQRAGGKTVNTVSETFTDSQLISALTPGVLNLLLPDASGQPALEALLPRLLRVVQAHPQYKVALLGYPDWQAYVGGHLDQFFALDTYVFSNFYYDSYSAAVKRFEKSYAGWFHTDIMPLYPRMALLGFDNGMHLLRGLSRYGKAFATQSVPATPFQSMMKFERVGPAGGVVNNHVWFVHYHRNRSIDKIAVK